MRVMVAVDGSSKALDALYAAKALLTPEDHLFLIVIGKDFTQQLYSTPGAPHLNELEAAHDKLQEAERTRAKQILKSAAKHVVEFRPTLLFATSLHIGEAICLAVKAKEIHHLYLGFNGWEIVRLALMGSVSKYCIQEAECSVFVIKKKHYHHEKNSNPRPSSPPHRDEDWTQVSEQNESNPVGTAWFEFSYFPIA